MPSNKEALIRYRAINRCLIERRIASQNALIKACTDAVGAEISWRTIASDIRAMRQDETLGYFAPIKNIKYEGYTYTDPEYSIDNIPLKNEEVTALSFAARLLSNYSNVAIFSTFSGAVEKLSKNLNLQIRNKDVSDMGAYIAFEENTSDGGSIFIQEILTHIRQKTVIEMEYFSFSSNQIKKHNLHPYFLKEYRNRWYVVGYHNEYLELRTFALERIQTLVPQYAISYKHSEFNAEEYYKHAIGVSITQNKPEKVVLQVNPTQWNYLQTQPLHKSQKLIKTNKNYYVVEYLLIINYELLSLVLSMGSAAKVLNPERLRNKVDTEIKNMYQNMV